MRRWLRRRRMWFIGSGDGWPVAWRWAGFALVFALVGALGTIIAVQNQKLDALQSSTVSEFEVLKDQFAQAQQKLAHLQGENSVLRETLASQKDVVEQARLVNNTAESQQLADQAMLSELKRQLLVLESENAQLKTDLGFFEAVIPKGKGSTRQRVKTITAARIDPTHLQWRALIVQANKNPDEFKGELVFVVQGQLDGQPWQLSTRDAPTPVSLVQYVRIDGVIVVPEALEVESLTAQLRQSGKLISSATVKVKSK